MSIEIYGLDGILDKFDSCLDKERINKALKEACALVERDAIKNAPKDNGELRRSITSEVCNGVGVVFTPKEYAPYIEYGTGLFAEAGDGRKDVPWNYKDDEGNWHTTSGIKPHPFMRPALNENRDSIKQILKGALVHDRLP